MQSQANYNKKANVRLGNLDQMLLRAKRLLLALGRKELAKNHQYSLPN